MIDWQMVVLKLKRAGYTAAAIEEKTGISVARINLFARDNRKEPKFSEGVTLLDFAHDVLPFDEFKRCRVAA